MTPENVFYEYILIDTYLRVAKVADTPYLPCCNMNEANTSYMQHLWHIMSNSYTYYLILPTKLEW